MLAALLHGYGAEFALEEVEAPPVPPQGALVRVAGAGVCRSDLYVRSGQRPIISQFPWILGHENAGYIEAVGAETTFWDIGEPVAIFGGWGCGICRWCSNGSEHLCNLQYRCGSGRPGGFAELLAVPASRHLVALGDTDPVLAAPLTDAGVTPYRAVRKVANVLLPGDLAVVIGIGGLGQFAIQYLRVLTEARIAAVDTAEHSLQRARELGADIVVSGTSNDVVEELLAHNAREKATAVLDFVGSDESLELASRICGMQGTIVLVGLSGGSLRYSYDGLPSEARVMSSTWGSRQDLEDVVALLNDGKITVNVETHPLGHINQVFDRLERGEVRGRAVLQP